MTSSDDLSVDDCGDFVGISSLGEAIEGNWRGRCPKTRRPDRLSVRDLALTEPALRTQRCHLWKFGWLKKPAEARAVVKFDVSMSTATMFEEMFDRRAERVSRYTARNDDGAPHKSTFRMFPSNIKERNDGDMRFL